MMTHEEIEYAIERLRKLSHGARTYSALDVVKAVIHDGSWTDGLIDLLRQADPDTHMELPRDADGMPIHVGDELVDYDTPRTVSAVSSDSVCLCGYRDGGDWYRMGVAENYPHYHKPTVEDVLVDYYKECQLHASKVGLLGLATNEDDERAWRGIATAFVEKLREVMADDRYVRGEGEVG